MTHPRPAVLECRGVERDTRFHHGLQVILTYFELDELCFVQMFYAVIIRDHLQN